MNAWNSKIVEPGAVFRVTASGAGKMKVAVTGGAGSYTLESSFDGGTTWVSSGLSVASGSEGAFVANPASPVLLSSLGRVTGAAGATVYVMQED